MKKKLLILINSDLYVRNYFYNNSFKYLISKFDCHFIGFKKNITNKKKFKSKIKKNKFLGFIDYPEYKILEFEKKISNNFLINKNKSKNISHIIKDRNSPKFIWTQNGFSRYLYVSFKIFHT